jgi:hypothetical protein
MEASPPPLRVRRTAMTIAERLSRWLQQNDNGAYCDDCIARELELSQRRQASRASKALSTVANFFRARGICSICGAEKKVIRAV